MTPKRFIETVADMRTRREHTPTDSDDAAETLDELIVIARELSQTSPNETGDSDQKGMALRECQIHERAAEFVLLAVTQDGVDLNDRSQPEAAVQIVRAVLKAMCNPSDDMLASGVGYECHSRTTTKELASAIWEGMVDTALEASFD